MADFGSAVDRDDRTVDARIFSSREIYDREQELIFGKSWLYLGHASQLPEKGSFVSTFMGEDAVILWRGSDGKVRAFLNSCPHRGMKVCPEDEGKAARFTCPYHAWTFDSKGSLVGRAFSERYDDLFDPKRWGLIEVARVEDYAGLYFGNFDPDAPSLDDYLGEVKWYFDTQFKRTSDGVIINPGVQKWTVYANWKLLFEQLAGDNYHASITHISAGRVGLLGDLSQFAKAAPYEQDFEIKTSAGHGWISLNPSVSPFADAEQYERYEAKVRSEARGRLTDKQADLTIAASVGTIFPSFGFISFLGGLGLRVMHPRGPDKTEVWFWNASDAEAPDWRRALSRNNNIRSFTAAGLLEGDDAEMWMGCYEALKGPQRKKYPLNYQLGGWGTERRENERPGLIDVSPSEIGVMGFYERWSQLMGNAQ